MYFSPLRPARNDAIPKVWVPAQLFAESLIDLASRSRSPHVAIGEQYLLRVDHAEQVLHYRSKPYSRPDDEESLHILNSRAMPSISPSTLMMEAVWP